MKKKLLHKLGNLCKCQDGSCDACNKYYKILPRLKNKWITNVRKFI